MSLNSRGEHTLLGSMQINPALVRQSTLRHPEVHIHAIHFNVNAWFVWHL